MKLPRWLPGRAGPCEAEETEVFAGQRPRRLQFSLGFSSAEKSMTIASYNPTSIPVKTLCLDGGLSSLSSPPSNLPGWLQPTLLIWFDSDFLCYVKNKEGMVSTVKAKRNSSKITPKVISGQIGFFKKFFPVFLYLLLFYFILFYFTFSHRIEFQKSVNMKHFILKNALFSF